MARSPPTFAPLRPSRLRIPSGPLSPASPLSPLLLRTPSPPSPTSSISTSSSSTSMSDLPPPLPMSWIWQCHECQSLYPIGATRRCLHDGHLFCSGTTTTTSRTGRAKRHKACASEYDYVGWRRWGDWKRTQCGYAKEINGECGKDCMHQCDFPSECHWSAKGAVEGTTFDSMSIDTINTNTMDDDSMDIDSPSSSTSPSNTQIPTDVPPPPTHLVDSLQKRSTVYLDKLVRAAERRTAQLATLLSPIAEEPDSKPSSPRFGLGLSMAVLDFPSFKSNLDTYNQKSLVITNEELAASFEGGLQTPTWFKEELMDCGDDEGMSSPHSGTSSPLMLSPSESGEAERGVFEFDLGDGKNGDAPPSPRQGAWDWRMGGVGVAVSSPVKRRDRGRRMLV